MVFVTVMGADPAVPAGTTATIVPSSVTDHDVAFTAANFTPVVGTVPVNPVPRMVTMAPAAAPEGSADVMTGTAPGAAANEGVPITGSWTVACAMFPSAV